MPQAEYQYEKLVSKSDFQQRSINLPSLGRQRSIPKRKLNTSSLKQIEATEKSWTTSPPETLCQTSNLIIERLFRHSLRTSSNKLAGCLRGVRVP